MFKRKSESEQVIALKTEINNLEGSLCKAKGLLEVEKERVVFYKDRGDRYMAVLKEREAESKTKLELAEKLLIKIMDPAEIVKCIEAKK